MSFLQSCLTVLSVMFLLLVGYAFAQTYLGKAGTYVQPGVVSVASIDGKTVADTTIFTNSSGSDFYVTAVHIVLTAVSGLGTPPVVSVGITGAGYTDFVNAFALTALTAASTVIQPTLVAARVRVPSGTALVCRVGTAAIATTTYTFTCIAQGFYL